MMRRDIRVENSLSPDLVFYLSLYLSISLLRTTFKYYFNDTLCLIVFRCFSCSNNLFNWTFEKHLLIDGFPYARSTTLKNSITSIIEQ